jgi:hypothetical protein
MPQHKQDAVEEVVTRKATVNVHRASKRWTIDGKWSHTHNLVTKKGGSRTCGDIVIFFHRLPSLEVVIIFTNHHYYYTIFKLHSPCWHILENFTAYFPKKIAPTSTKCKYPFVVAITFLWMQYPIFLWFILAYHFKLLPK